MAADKTKKTAPVNISEDDPVIVQQRKRRGRPRIPINADVFEALCYMQCTEEEICAYYNCSDETLNNWCKSTYKMTFEQAFSQMRKGGHISLRRRSWKRAFEGNSDAVLIFLLKNYLKMCDDPRKYDKDDTQDDKIGAMVAGLQAMAQAMAGDDNDDDPDES